MSILAQSGDGGSAHCRRPLDCSLICMRTMRLEPTCSVLLLANNGAGRYLFAHILWFAIHSNGGKYMNPTFFHQSVGRSWWLILLLGILSVIFGLVCMVNPVSAGASLTWAIGVLAIAEGVTMLLATFKKDASASPGWMLLYAIVSIAFGVLAVINPISMAASIIWVMAIWIIVAGLMRITFAVRVRKAINNEWLLILSGLLAVVLGGLMLFAPVAGLILAVIWIGAGALIYGFLQIFAAFRIRKLITTKAAV